jgi:hypothetical protein
MIARAGKTGDRIFVPTTANEVLEPWLAMQIEIH